MCGETMRIISIESIDAPPSLTHLITAHRIVDCEVAKVEPKKLECWSDRVVATTILMQGIGCRLA